MIVTSSHEDWLSPAEDMDEAIARMGREHSRRECGSAQGQG